MKVLATGGFLLTLGLLLCFSGCDTGSKTISEASVTDKQNKPAIKT